MGFCIGKVLGIIDLHPIFLDLVLAKKMLRDKLNNTVHTMKKGEVSKLGEHTNVGVMKKERWQNNQFSLDLTKMFGFPLNKTKYPDAENAARIYSALNM